MAEIIWLFLKRNYKAIMDVIAIVALVWFSMWLADLIFKIAAPIVFGACIYLLIAPTVRFLTKLKIKRGTATGIALVGYLFIIVVAIIGGTIIAGNQAQSVASKMPTYIEILKDTFSDDFKEVSRTYQNLPYGIPEKINEKAIETGEKMTSVASNLFFTFVDKVSSSLIFLGYVLLGLIFAYFLGKDEEKMQRLFKEYSPSWLKEAWKFLSANVIKGINNYIKAQFKMISITFGIILIALLAFGVKNAFVVALVAAIFDVLPLLGIATIFVPWIIYLIVIGNVSLAIKLGVLYLIVFLSVSGQEDSLYIAKRLGGDELLNYILTYKISTCF